METSCVFLSLGSNIGNREANLRQGVDRLASVMKIRRVSSLYDTEPVGVSDQPAFLNLVVKGTTTLRPPELLQAVKGIEHDVGRRPTYRWGPRVLDIDILLCGETVVNSAELTVPHPEMAKRAFVLVPLAEIAPETRHPVLGITIRQLSDEVDGRDGVRKVGAYQNP